MTANPYRASLKQAQRVDRELERLFARYLGSAEHPRGAVLTAYRVAIAAIEAIYRRGAVTLESEVRDVLSTAQMTLEGIARQAIIEAEAIGRKSAEEQLAAYQRAGVGIEPARGRANTGAMLAGMMTGVTAQLTNAAMMAAAGSPVGMVQAALVPAQIQREGSRLMAQVVNETFEKWVSVPKDAAYAAPGDDIVFQRQAIAAVDGRTTDCCLNVTGQIVGMDEPFHLTGDPRPWGDDIMRPPFHWNCRTSAVLYQAEFDDGVTAELRELAQNEKGRRAEYNKQIAEIKKELAKRGQTPDARKRKADDKETRKLRRELKRLRKELLDIKKQPIKLARPKVPPPSPTFTPAKTVEEAYELAEAHGLKVAGQNADEMVELLAESHVREFGDWTKDRPKSQFVKNWKPVMKKAIAPPEFQRDVINGVVEQISAGRAEPYPLVIHGEREGYNDLWMEGQHERGLIRIIYHPSRSVSYQGLTLQDTLGTVPETYTDPYGGFWVHEWGHEMHDRNPQWLRRAATVIDDRRDFIKANISRYAVHNPRELAAEAFTMRQHPAFDTLGTEVKQLINWILEEEEL